MAVCSTDAGGSFVSQIHHDTYPFISPEKSKHSGHHVFISGASKGIGLTTSISFAKAGASVIAIAARSDLSSVVSQIQSAAKEAGHPKPKILPYKMDISSQDSIESTAKSLAQDLPDGRLDILINNAGYLETWKPIGESDPDDWWKTWELNVRGLYLCVRSFLPFILKEGSSKQIINISSRGAHRIRTGASAYQTTKFAVCRITEFLDFEYKDQGLIAFALHPGGVKTELAFNMPKEMHGILIDEPELAADVMSFLTAERHPFLGGRYISVDWDMEELLSKEKEIVEKDLLKFRMGV